LWAFCGIAGYTEKDQKKDEDRESIEKDLKSPIINNIAMCLIKQGKIQRANFYLDLLLTGAKPIDPTNFKAWKRKIDNLLALGNISQAKKAIAKAETYAETISEKTFVTNFYRDLA
jgi:tetratricopeptide (TPR) repeat protein